MQPDAETFARRSFLPVKVCSVTKELYGCATPVLDEVRVAQMLAVTDYSSANKALILTRMQERVERLAEKA